MVRIRFPPGESPQTIGSADDFTRLIPIIQNHAGSIAKFLGDGVIATFGVARPSPTYAADATVALVCQRHPDAAVIVPPRSGAVPSATAKTAPTKRDRHLQLIAERGRMGWQRASGYNWRALVEADIGRYKRVIGDALRSRTEGRQMTEVAIAAASLNRMLELGRPVYVRLT
jgi:class 3 adenylate cyclase